MNPYCEWIGAQIRADPYGYVFPGEPAKAARLAWNDAAASHVKNGIYGAMWVAACIAAAYVEDDPERIIMRGLEQVPSSCRLREHVTRTVEVAKRNGDDYEKTFSDIDQHLGHYHCVHTVNNACIVVAGLIHGGRDFGRCISIAVMGGLDTDCNGATAGSIAGTMLGTKEIPGRWRDVFNDTLHTSVVGEGVLRISALARETVELAQRLRAGN
jgi:ADP-ribosylglycohydrolase